MQISCFYFLWLIPLGMGERHYSSANESNFKVSQRSHSGPTPKLSSAENEHESCVFFNSSFIHFCYKLATIVNGENFEPTVSLSILLYHQPVIPCIFTSNRKFQEMGQFIYQSFDFWACLLFDDTWWNQVWACAMGPRKALLCYNVDLLLRISFR